MYNYIKAFICVNRTEKYMNKPKRVLLYICTFFGTIALLWLMLVLSALIPNAAIKANMERSALSYKQTEAFHSNTNKRFCDISDNYADAILLNVAWNMGKDNPLVSTLDTKYFDGGALGVNAGFYLELTDRSPKSYTDYSRYWHGSAAPVRLFHLVTDVNGIKTLGLVTVLALILICVAMLLFRRHYVFALCFVLTFCTIHIWNIWLALEYQPGFIIALIFCILFMAFERRGSKYLPFLSVICGTTIAFFDFLTIETVSLVLPLILVVSIRARENRLGSFKDNIGLIALCGLCWLLAYGATFLFKWSTASLVTGENKFLTALASAGERFGGTTDIASKHPLKQLLLAPLANLSALFGGTARVDMAAVIRVLCISIPVFVSALYISVANLPDKTLLKLLALLGMVIFVRYITLNNHSYLHSFFTYRALCTTVLSLLSGTALCFEQRPLKRKGKSK